MLAMGRDSLAHAFVQPEEKARLLAAFDTRIASFEQRYGAPSLEGALGSLASVKPVTYGYARRNWGFDFN
jgi:adenosine deaminase CECR1